MLNGDTCCIVIVRGTDLIVWFVGRVESTTCKVNAGKVPVVVETPVISPDLGFRLSPVGSWPDVMLQANGVTPPVVEMGAVYGYLANPVGNEVVVIESSCGGLTTIV
jgi:hypothetical protein